MHLIRIVFKNRIGGMALMVAALSLFVAGCASPPPPYRPPGTEAILPPPALTSDQLAKLCQASPDTCHRVQTAQPLTLADVKVMTKIGFSSDVIITQVRNSRTVFHLTANAIIDLKNSGVSDQVIDFLMTTPDSIAGSSPVPEPSNSSMTVQTPPPPPPDETPLPSPGPDYVWIGGDWVWNGGWVWVGGRWALPASLSSCSLVSWRLVTRLGRLLSSWPGTLAPIERILDSGCFRSAGFQACCIAGFPTRRRLENG